MENDPTTFDAGAQPVTEPAALGIPPATLDMQPVTLDAQPTTSDVQAVALDLPPAHPETHASDAHAVEPGAVEPHAAELAAPTEADGMATTPEPFIVAPDTDLPPGTMQANAVDEASKAQDTAERRRRAEEQWAALSGSRSTRAVVEGTVKSAVKGGFLVAFGPFRGFLPASQSRLMGIPTDKLPGTTLPLIVIDVDESKKRVVVSHRLALEAQRRDARKALLASLRVGSEHQATVVRLADFGAFVDLGGIDALVPVGELALERVEKPGDCVKVGDRFAVRILRVDAGGKKIGASRKAMLPDPWRDHASLLSRGKIVQGTVVANTTELQIEVAPGIVGTVSENEATPGDYAIGEMVEVSIRAADFQRRRLRLSTMHATPTFGPTSFAPLGDELKA